MNIFRIFSAGLGALALTLSAHAAGGSKHAEAPEGGWPFAGPVGQLEMDGVQRGYQVYREVCSSCHGLKLLSYRNLGEKGGPFYDPRYPNANDNPLVKAFAAESEILDPVPNDVGDFDYRPARPSDRFRSPYANQQAARAANGGAYPPDLSVITKARGHGEDGSGASYIYALLTGYPTEAAFSQRLVTPEVIVTAYSDNGTPEDPSDDIAEVKTPAVYETVIDVTKLKGYKDKHEGDEHHGEKPVLVQPVGQYYNPYMAGDTAAQWEGDPRHKPYGGFLAMPPQLTPDRVTYMDGTEASVEQMAYDVAQFLQWAGDPKQAARKSLGLPTLIYLVLLAILLWFSYKQIWRNVEH